MLKLNVDYWLVDATDEIDLEKHYIATITEKNGIRQE